MSKVVIISGGILVLVLMCLNASYGFPDGSPVDACVKERPNQPYHGQYRPQPLASSPYQILASSTQYSPGKQIRVAIRGDTFKGFFIQARDANTNEWLGKFAQTPNTKVHSECSAITHADPKDKKEATLVWNAPTTGQGQVYFTGSVLKDYSIFWADLASK